MARHERAAALRAAARLSAGGGGGENGVAVGTGGPGGVSAAAARAAARARAAQASLAARRRARALERAQEVEDSPAALRDKCRRLARALRNAKHLVVYTGAGISTAADIPDYRGPRGVWTRLQRGESVERVDVSRARPTLTHMALTALWARGTLKFVVSQNCDGLHVRAGLPRRALAELHGDMFAERCAACRRVYLRAFDTTERTARHAHATPRLCHACGAQLADTIVHFGERGRAAWPLNWAGALRHAAAADVVLCLGSSLKVLRRYPRLWRMQSAPHARPALYIVNLQWTPKDAVAELKINARCDDVMAQVARRLRLRVPRYTPRRDPLLAHAEPLAAPEEHTTGRPPLSPAPSSVSEPSDTSPPSSPSASDSDDEVPLRRLAERLHPPPPPLTAFQVPLRSGEATILLRAEHAPRAPSELRRFRMTRPLYPSAPAHSPHSPHSPHPVRLNGHGPPPPPQDNPPPPSPSFAKLEPHDGYDFDFNGRLGSPRPHTGIGSAVAKLELKPKLENGSPERKAKMEADPKTESESSESSCSSGSSESEAARQAEAEGVAAAIIARAVAVCRAVYPGLHTILVPPAPECAWCARTHGARRCLWYGPPRLTPPERRAWRRVRARRYLCACCPSPALPAAGGGGWYGKGYRKGRRRR